MDWGTYRWSRPSDLNLLAEGTFECGFCGGSGESPGSSGKCAVCRGDGRVEVDPPAVRCTYCAGRGMMGGRSSNLTCTVCGGKGIITIKDLREPIETCPECRGTCRHPENKLPCTTCRGRGVVSGG